MPTPWPTSTRPASRISETVAERLARAPGGTNVVHSVFRSALNISTIDGLLTIAPASTGALPNGIVVDLALDFRAIGVRAGMAVDTTTRRLRIEAAGLTIDLAGAARWSPRLAAPVDGTGPAAARWRQRSGQARAFAAALASAGPAWAVGGLAGVLGATHSEAGIGAVELAGPILARLQAALRDEDLAAARAAGRSLIGLGPGLTPSGDDALVGIEAASWALRAPMAGFLDDALDDVDDRTTAVAATFLRHAATGAFAERLHALLGALLGPDDAAIPAALERAVAWGATSGTDCLAGVFLGLDAGTNVRMPD